MTSYRWTLCFWSSKKATIELIRPRLAIDSADRTKLDIKNGHKREEAGLTRAFCANDAGVVRWRCCVVPIVQILGCISGVDLERNCKAKAKSWGNANKHHFI